MLKKLIYLLPFFVAVFSFNAVAASSIGLLGGKSKPNVNVAKTATITPKNQPAKKHNVARIAKDLESPNLKKLSSDDADRFPTIIKTISKPSTINTNVAPKPVVGDASENSFNSLVQRVEVLESQSANTVTDVVEYGSGPYVNEVTKEGNKLNVTKTNLLYAPVRNASGTTVSGNAEIWIIK